MTVASYNDRKSGPTAGNGSAVQFAFDFYIEKKEWADVISRNTTTGVEITKQEGVDYTFDVGSLKNAAGGNITFTTAPAADEEIMINGESGDLQEYNASAGNSVNSTDLEAAFDRVMRSVQELRRNADLSGVRLSTFPGAASLTLLEFLAADVNKFLMISDEDPPTLVPGTLSTTALASTSFGESILAAANAAAARALMFNAFIDSLLDDTTAAVARRTLATDEVVMLGDDDTDDVVELFNDGTIGANIAFTGVDITSSVRAGHTARYAILRVNLRVIQTTTGTTRQANVDFRRTGNTVQTKFQGVEIAVVAAEATNSREYADRQMIVPLDSGESFDYKVTLSAAEANQVRLIIDLEGYIR